MVERAPVGNGPPLDCRPVQGRRRAVCVEVSALPGNLISGALGDDMRVLVLINPSVTEDAVSTPDFPTRR